MEKVKNVVFKRKVENIHSLESNIGNMTKREVQEEQETVVVVKEIKMENIEYVEFAAELLRDREWIKKEDSGKIEGYDKVIRVINTTRNQSLYIKGEGYNYPRYVGQEVK